MGREDRMEKKGIRRSGAEEGAADPAKWTRGPSPGRNRSVDRRPFGLNPIPSPFHRKDESKNPAGGRFETEMDPLVLRSVKDQSSPSNYLGHQETCIGMETNTATMRYGTTIPRRSAYQWVGLGMTWNTCEEMRMDIVRNENWSKCGSGTVRRWSWHTWM